LAARLDALGVEAVAVSLLHSYANPDHERRVAHALRLALPQVHVTASHELLPELREYERGATCAANAVVAPKMGAYVSRLATHLPSLRIMGSDGGTLPVETVLRAPVHTVLSGPAGGVVGALVSAREALDEPAPRLMSFDMGGTSTDVALCEGEPSRTTEGRVGPLPIRVPLVDIHTVGAGGGSVAWVDPGGALRVGPQSCGASPGPACYGLQRPPYRPSVTDAHLVLGRLPPDRFLGGAMHLDLAAAQAALDALAETLGVGRVEAALGVLRVVEATMARALKVISVARGHDPRHFALACFGGAGGLHACRLADELGMRRVVLPLDPGLLSARGMLDAPASVARSRALMRRVDPSDPNLRPLVSWTPVADALADLETRALAQLDSEGLPTHSAHLWRGLDLRYVGQSHELCVPLQDGASDPLAAFAAQHRKLYGYDIPGRAVEVVAARVRAEVPAPSSARTALGARGAGEQAPSVAVRAWFDEQEEEGRLFERADLRAGDALEGPLLLSEFSATTVVPRGWSLRVTARGHIVLERGTP
jgi:N-methylhydantoinase A